MRTMPALMTLLLLVLPAAASGQSFQVQGSAGATVLDSSQNLFYGFDPGHSLAAGMGFNPTPRVSLLVGRLVIGGEAQELFAMLPLRAGLGWRF